MRRSILAIGISLFMAFLYFGCGGGGDDEASSVGNLQGTWLGVIEDENGNLEEFSLQIDGSGNIVEVKIADVPTGDTGRINEDWDENLFHVLYDFNPGISSPLGGGIMIVDNQYRHATYGDWSDGLGFFIGVLEKGAAGFPAYASSDIVENYTVGGAYEFDFSVGTWEGDAISMTVNPDLTFTGSSPDGPFSGGFDASLYMPSYGRYAGTLTRDIIPPMTLDITALVSPDKTYVAAYAKEISMIQPSLDDFILIGLMK